MPRSSANKMTMFGFSLSLRFSVALSASVSALRVGAHHNVVESINAPMAILQLVIIWVSFLINLLFVANASFKNAVCLSPLPRAGLLLSSGGLEGDMVTFLAASSTKAHVLGRLNG